MFHQQRISLPFHIFHIRVHCGTFPDRTQDLGLWSLETFSGCSHSVEARSTGSDSSLAGMDGTLRVGQDRAPIARYVVRNSHWSIVFPAPISRAGTSLSEHPVNPPPSPPVVFHAPAVLGLHSLGACPLRALGRHEPHASRINHGRQRPEPCIAFSTSSCRCAVSILKCRSRKGLRC